MSSSRIEGVDITDEYLAFTSVLLGDTQIKIEYAEDCPTAVCYPSLDVIIVTDKLIPPDLRKDDLAKRVYIRGQIAHEQGHIKFYPKEKRIRAKLGWRVGLDKGGTLNIIEDAIINRQMINRWRYSFGREIEAVIRIAARQWANAIPQKDKAKPDLSHAIDSAVMLSLYGYLLTKQENKPVEQIISKYAKKKLQNSETTVGEDAKRVIAIIKQARWTVVVDTLSELARELWELLSKYGLNQMNQCLRYAPSTIDGKESPEDAGEEGKTEVHLSSTERSNADEGEDDQTGSGKVDQSDGSKGYTGGEEDDIPPPDINNAIYQDLLKKTREERERLRNRIVFTMPAKLERVKREESGIFMPSTLPRIICGINRIKRGRERNRRTHPIASYDVTIVVDFSGSVNTREAQLCLTILADAMTYALGSGRVEILLFGNSLQRLKNFKEEWHLVQSRIGGIECLGGTSPTKAFKVGLERLGARPGIPLFIYVGDLAHPPRDIKTILKKSGAIHIALQIHDYPHAGVAQLFDAHRETTWTNLPESLIDALRGVVSIAD